MFVLIISLLFSAFFSAAETTFVSLDTMELRVIKKKHLLLGKLVEYLQQRIDQLLNTIVIGNNTANVLFSVATTRYTIEIIGNNAVAVMTGIIVFIMLVFGEITPKQIALKYNCALAAYLSPVLIVFYFLLLPFSKIFLFFSYLIGLTRQQKKSTAAEGVYHEHLTAMLLQMGENKNIKMSNTRRIRRAVEISEKEVCSIMTHRKDVHAISSNKTIDDAFNLVSKVYFKHLPIYEDTDKEKFIGVIHVRQILQAKKLKKGHELLFDTVKRLKKECKVLTLPEFLPIVKALPLFQEKQKTFAIVIDEFGGLAGVLSLSDIAQYILTPDLFSENNEDSANVPTLQYSSEYVKARPSAPKGFIYFDVKAETPLSEIEEMLSVQIYPRPESHTIAGYLIEYTGGDFLSGGTSKKNKVQHPVLGEFSITKKTTAKIISLQWKMSKELEKNEEDKGSV